MKLSDRLRLHFARIPTDLPRLSGPCLVLGSAPSPVLPPGLDASWRLVTVNASQVSAATLGLPAPAVTVISGQMLGQKPANVEAKRVLAGHSTGAIIFIERGFSMAEARAQFSAMKYRYAGIHPLSFHQREKMVRQILKADYGPGSGEKKISTGLFAAVLALYLGGAPVVMSGFSLKNDGHAYNSQGHRREHKETDTRVLAIIRDAGLAIYAADPVFAQQSGLRLYGPGQP